MIPWLDTILNATRSLWSSSRPSSNQAVRFSFDEVETRFLGKIKRPTATVRIWSDVFNQWEKVQMLIDTGADYTLFPQYLGYLFTTKRNGANQRTTVGVGGSHTVYFIDQVKVKVGPFERQIPAGISSSNQIPPLMGRHLFFETFHTEFDHNRTVRFSE